MDFLWIVYLAKSIPFIFQSSYETCVSKVKFFHITQKSFIFLYMFQCTCFKQQNPCVIIVKTKYAIIMETKGTTLTFDNHWNSIDIITKTKILMLLQKMIMHMPWSHKCKKVTFFFVPWANCTLPIITLLMLCTFLLFNALSIRRYLYNKETLCKHNWWKMGNEHVVKLGFHTCQYKETSLVFHIANYLRNSYLNQFHLHWEN